MWSSIHSFTLNLLPNMAQLVSLNVYKINQRDDLSSGNSQRISFPFAGILIRPINGGFVTLSGTIIYSNVQLLQTGDLYGVVETPTAISALS